MMRHLYPFLEKSAAAILAICISCVLFALIAVGQHIYTTRRLTPARDTTHTRRIIAEVITPPEPSKKQPTVNRRLRQVAPPPGKELTRPLDMRFSPDLSVTSGAHTDAAAVGETDMQAFVFSQGEVDVRPAPRHTPRPSYPSIAQRLEIRGNAVVTFIIGIEGQVEQITSVNAPHPSIAREVRGTIMKWRFEPARKDGVPVRCHVTKTFEFDLR
jgi:protein TonB